MRSALRQRGAGVTNFIVLAGLVAIITLWGIQLVPIYFEALTVRTVVKTLAQDPALRGASHRDVRSSIERRLQLNNVTRVSGRDIALTNGSQGLQVVLEYEARVPLLGNLDGVASFRHQTVIPQ